mmetsp:Transcript_2767/g.10601  ORF Transcript_2767/g.10601 Transcript_2767/m.10601 type:complete len:229 (-) Transcript_2767:215-901(-)
MTLTRVPGTIFCTKFRSTIRVTFRGISPAGTSSGFSCIFSTCWSMNFDRSKSTWYGSSPHPPSVDVSGLALAWSHIRGMLHPPKPPPRCMYFTLRQVLHWMARRLALLRVLDAAMTIPGTHTNRDTSLLVNPRSARGVSSLDRCTCICSSAKLSLLPPTPPTMSFARGFAFREWRKLSTVATHEASKTGTYTSGLRRSSFASPGSCAMTSSNKTVSSFGGWSLSKASR